MRSKEGDTSMEISPGADSLDRHCRDCGRPIDGSGVGTTFATDLILCFLCVLSVLFIILNSAFTLLDFSPSPGINLGLYMKDAGTAVLFILAGFYVMKTLLVENTLQEVKFNRFILGKFSNVFAYYFPCLLVILLCDGIRLSVISDAAKSACSLSFLTFLSNALFLQTIPGKNFSLFSVLGSASVLSAASLMWWLYALAQYAKKVFIPRVKARTLCFGNVMLLSLLLIPALFSQLFTPRYGEASLFAAGMAIYYVYNKNDGGARAASLIAGIVFFYIVYISGLISPMTYSVHYLLSCIVLVYCAVTLGNSFCDKAAGRSCLDRRRRILSFISMASIAMLLVYEPVFLVLRLLSAVLGQPGIQLTCSLAASALIGALIVVAGNWGYRAYCSMSNYWHSQLSRIKR